MSLTLDDTQTQANEIENDLDKLQDLINEISENSLEVASSFSVSKKASKDLDTKMSGVMVKLTSVQKKLTEFQRTVQIINRESGRSVHYRVRESQLNVFTNRMRQLMNQYQEVQTNFSNKTKTQIKKQLSVVGKNVTEEELEQLLEKEDQALFTENLLGDTLKQKQALQDIQDRHSQLLKVEESVRELNFLFVQIATLVEEQGTVIDTIEAHVVKTSDHVENGRQQLVIARQKQTKARKCKIILIVVAIIVVVIIAVSIYMSVK